MHVLEAGSTQYGDLRRVPDFWIKKDHRKEERMGGRNVDEWIDPLIGYWILAVIE
jgi:hypothetical protein